MYQFCYASESTSSKADLLQDLTDILKEARDFNHPNQITGVLHFADGHFSSAWKGNV